MYTKRHHQKYQNVVEKNRTKILSIFSFQTNKHLLKMAVVIDVAITAENNIRETEHEKIEKHQGLKEQLEQMWKVKCNVIPFVVGPLGAVTPKLGEWLQQIPGSTPEASFQKSAVLGTAKILSRNLRLRLRLRHHPMLGVREPLCIYIYIYPV